MSSTRIRRLASWRATVTFRPVFVAAFVIVDVLLRLAAPLLEWAIKRHPQILDVLNFMTSVLLFFAMVVLAAAAISPEERRGRDC